MLVRMLMVCFAGLPISPLVIVIGGFSIAFMLLGGAVDGQSGLLVHTAGTVLADLDALPSLLPKPAELLARGNGTFDVVDLPVALADTFAILLGAFDHTDLWDRGPMTFGCWVLYMLFGNIILLNGMPGPTPACAVQMHRAYTAHSLVCNNHPVLIEGGIRSADLNRGGQVRPVSRKHQGT
jgi:hypothetical protein